MKDDYIEVNLVDAHGYPVSWPMFQDVPVTLVSVNWAPNNDPEDDRGDRFTLTCQVRS